MDDTLFTMTYTLNSGIKGSVNLSNNQINQWVECFKTGNKFTTNVGLEHFGLNPNSVADYKVHNSNTSHRVQIEAIQPKLEEGDLERAYDNKKINAKISCRVCTTVYHTELPYKMNYTTCSKCKHKVFVQNEIDTVNGKGYLYTNIKEV